MTHADKKCLNEPLSAAKADVPLCCDTQRAFTSYFMTPELQAVYNIYDLNVNDMHIFMFAAMETYCIL